MVQVLDPQSGTLKDTGAPPTNPTTTVDYLINALQNPWGKSTLPGGAQITFQQAREYLQQYGYSSWGSEREGPSSTPSTQADFWSRPENTEAGREAAAMANTASSPKSVGVSSPVSTYTDPRTGQTFATKAIAADLGYTQQQQQSQSLSQIAQQGSVDRPNYYGLANEGLDPSITGGDSRTQGIALAMKALSISQRVSQRVGAPGVAVPEGFKTDYGRTMSALDIQRQYAALSGDNRATQYFLNEEKKVSMQPIEKSAEYHYIGKYLDIPIPANPFELQADFAVELSKGAPQSDKERFSPVSGYISTVMPYGGLGFNDLGWYQAKTGAPVAGISYLPAINVLSAAEGKYGPYGRLYGGPDYIGTPSSEGIRKQADFVMTPEIGGKAQRAVVLGRSPAGGNAGSTSMSFITQVGESKETKELPKVVMVKAPDGTMQPDYMVPFGNITGRKVVAAEGTRIDYQPGTEIAAVKPFVAGKVTDFGTQFVNWFTGGKTWAETEKTVVAGTKDMYVPPVEPDYGTPTANFYDVYSSKQKEYENQLAAYEAGGRTDVGAYQNLLRQEKELKMLGTAYVGLETLKWAAEISYVKPEPEKSPTIFDIYAPEGSFQRGVLEKTTIGIPGGLTLGTQMEMASAAVKDIRVGDFANLWKDINAPASKQYAFALPDTSKIAPSDIGKGLAVVGTVANPFLYPVLATKEGQATTEFTGAFGQEIYERSRLYPIENAILSSVPGAFKVGESLVSRGIARATITPGLKTAGRLLSTPLATDIGQYVVKGALVAPWIYESGKSIYEAPMTPAGKGKAAGYVGYQLAWMAGPGGKIAEEIKTFQPENTFYGKGFFSGVPEARPIQTAKGDLTISLAAAEMRLRGMPDEAQYLKSTWNIAKATRFAESPQENPTPLDFITDVPLEHRIPLEKALTTNVVLGYGSGFSYGQMKPSQRFPDTRLVDVELLQSGVLKGKLMGERFEAIDAAKEPEFPLGEYPVSQGSDIDIFGDVAGVKSTLASEPGTMVQIKTPGKPGKVTSYTIVEAGGERIKIYEKGYEPVGEPTYEYMPWEKASEQGYTIEDVGAIYSKGAKFALDPHEYPSGFPRLKSMTDEFRPKADTPAPEDWRVPLAFKILGSPFESIPRATDIMYIEKEPGKFIPQEKVGFQMQRLGDAISKNLMSGAERYTGDPLFRGYRFEKDLYRDISVTQQILGETRGGITKARAKIEKMPKGREKTAALKKLGIREQNIQYAEKEFAKKLDLDIRYQLERGEEPVVGKVRDIAEIGKERLGWGMTVGGKEIGPVRTTIGDVKYLSEYPAPAKRDIAVDIAWERKFIPKESQKIQPRSIKTKPVERQLLSEMAQPKRRSMEDLIKKYKNEPMEERVDTRDIVTGVEDAPLIKPIKTPTPLQKTLSTTTSQTQGTYVFDRWLNPRTSLKLTESDIALKFAQMEKMGGNELSIPGRRGENIKDFETLIVAGSKLGYRVTTPRYEPGIGQGETGTWIANFERVATAKGPTISAEPMKQVETTRDVRDMIEPELISKEPVFAREYKFGSGTVERAPAISKVGGVGAGIISRVLKEDATEKYMGDFGITVPTSLKSTPSKPAAISTVKPSEPYGKLSIPIATTAIVSGKIPIPPYAVESYSYEPPIKYELPTYPSSPTPVKSPISPYIEPPEPYVIPPPPYIPELPPSTGILPFIGGSTGIGGAKSDRRKLQLETAYIGPRSVRMIRPAGAPKLPWMTQARAPTKAPVKKPASKSRKKK